MDLQGLANLGEFVGGIAVILSLVYLALQVRQNTQSLRTENYARALERLAAMQDQLARDGELSRLFAKGVTDVASLTPPERIQFSWALYEAFGAFEFMFLAAQSRALRDEVWTRWASTVAWWLSFPGVQSWWRHRPAPFTATFSSFVDGILRDNPVDEAAAQRWRRFVAGDDSPLQDPSADSRAGTAAAAAGR